MGKEKGGGGYVVKDLKSDFTLRLHHVHTITYYTSTNKINNVNVNY